MSYKPSVRSTDLYFSDSNPPPPQAASIRPPSPNNNNNIPTSAPPTYTPSQSIPPTAASASASLSRSGSSVYNNSNPNWSIEDDSTPLAQSVPAPPQITSASNYIPRNYLKSEVEYSPTLQKWTALIQTNPNEVKMRSIGAFSSEAHARATILHICPIQWANLKECKVCTCCKKGFGFLKKAHNCRNCGAGVCDSCSSTYWPGKMLPITYTNGGKLKKTVRVCAPCNTSAAKFRSALLSGDLSTAITIYSTGNINLTTPYMNYPDAMYPLHCCAQGGNVDLFKYLVQSFFVPIDFKSKGRIAPARNADGKSILAIAAEYRSEDVVAYLMLERDVDIKQITEVEDLRYVVEIMMQKLQAERRENREFLHPEAAFVVAEVVPSAPMENFEDAFEGGERRSFSGISGMDRRGSGGGRDSFGGVGVE